MKAPHLASAQILAWMDGELPLWRRIRVSRHLRNCWECRNRAAELTEAIRLAEKHVSRPADRTGVAKAKWQFRERVREFEAAQEPRRRRVPLNVGVAASLVLAVLFGTPLLIERRPAPKLVPPSPRPRQSRPVEQARVAIGVRTPVEPVAPILSPVPAPLPPAVDESACNSAEVDVWSILHRSRLCLGGEIAVRRAQDGLTISGVLPTEDRRLQLMALFTTARHQHLLRLDLRTISELPPASGVSISQTALAAEAPAEKWLRARMRVGDVATQREMFDLMNAIAGGSESLLGECWALRRLAGRFPPELERALPEADRAQLRAMAEDHAIAAQNQVAALGQLLRPLGVNVASRGAAAGAPAWQAAALELQRRVAENTSVLLRLFTAGSRVDLPDGVEAEIARAAAGLGGISELAAAEREGLAAPVQSALRRP